MTMKLLTVQANVHPSKAVKVVRKNGKTVNWCAVQLAARQRLRLVRANASDKDGEDDSSLEDSDLYEGAAIVAPQEEGRSGLLALLSQFNPIKQKADKPYVLDFEKPLLELDKRIEEVRRVAQENGVDVSSQILELEERAFHLRKETYSSLTPTQKLQVARHPHRPTFLDIVLNSTDMWMEIHGDRAGYDDPALVCGLGTIEGQTFMFIGHQKGRNTKENIERNFGMPTPSGYRKALRMMKHAEHHGFPIFTFIDTPGAYAGLKAEEQGQGEAIARNLWEMAGVKVPIVTTVIGEGGSGGALAIGVCDRLLMMEHSVYYVASPEACAAILWKSREDAPQATVALKITAKDLVSMEVADGVIPEPVGGAHSEPLTACENVKEFILRTMQELKEKDTDTLLQERYDKFRRIGRFEEQALEEDLEEINATVNHNSNHPAVVSE